MKVQSLNEILETLELSFFPEKEFLKKHYKNLILKYHPDSSRNHKNHEKTIKIIEAYNQLMGNFHLYKFEYEVKQNEIEEKNQRKEENLIQILEYNSLLVGLPLKGLQSFLSSDQIKIVNMFDKTFLAYKNKFIPYYSIDKEIDNRFQIAALYNYNDFFAILFKQKIRFYDFIEIIPKKIKWDLYNGMYIYGTQSICIPSIFKDKKMLYESPTTESMSSYE